MHDLIGFIYSHQFFLLLPSHPTNLYSMAVSYGQAAAYSEYNFGGICETFEHGTFDSIDTTNNIAAICFPLLTKSDVSRRFFAF